VALALALSGGCQRDEPTRRLPAPEMHRSAALEPSLVRVLRRGNGHWSEQGTLAIADRPSAPPLEWVVAGDDYRFTMWLVPRPGSPRVLVLPHLEGTRRAEEYLTRRLAERGFEVVTVLPPREALPEDADAADWRLLLRGRIRGGRAALELASEELGPRCTVVVGLSVGALAAVPVAALEPSAKGIVTLLGGAGLHEIAADSDEPRLHSVSGELGSPEDGELDPLTWAPYIDPSGALLVRAAWDHVIPSEASERLRVALGGPRELTYPSGHYSFGVFLPLASGAVEEHVRKRCGAVR
jgi:dienelactone hydrolase